MLMRRIVLLLTALMAIGLGTASSAADDPSALPPVTVTIKAAAGGKLVIAVNDRELGAGDEGLKKLAAHMAAIFGGAETLPIAGVEIQVRAADGIAASDVFKVAQAAAGMNSRGKFVRWVNRISISWEK